MSDADILREAATCIHRLALPFDLEADRVEILGATDDRARQMLSVARELLGLTPDEEDPCG